MRSKVKRKLRDVLRLSGALLFFWLYIPHLIVVLAIGGGKTKILSDLDRLKKQVDLDVSKFCLFLYQER